MFRVNYTSHNAQSEDLVLYHLPAVSTQRAVLSRQIVKPFGVAVLKVQVCMDRYSGRGLIP